MTCYQVYDINWHLNSSQPLNSFHFFFLFFFLGDREGGQDGADEEEGYVLKLGSWVGCISFY